MSNVKVSEDDEKSEKQSANQSAHRTELQARQKVQSGIDGTSEP